MVEKMDLITNLLFKQACNDTVSPLKATITLSSTPLSHPLSLPPRESIMSLVEGCPTSVSHPLCQSFTDESFLNLKKKAPPAPFPYSLQTPNPFV